MTVRAPVHVLVTVRAPVHVLVTGGAGAIGAAIALAFARRTPSALISIVDVDGPGGARVAGALGKSARAFSWDLSKPELLPAAVAELERERGPVDALVNCAGIMEIRSLVATPWAVGERLLTIDLISPLRLMALITPGMKRRREGTVVNVSSMAGLSPIRGCVYYGAAKAGLAMASEVARLELRPFGVNVVTVYPGPVSSALERGARAQTPPSRLVRWLPTGEPSVLAERIVSACDKREARVVFPLLYSLAARAPSLLGRVTRRFSPVPLDA